MLAANAAPQMERGESVRATVIGRINSSSIDLSSLDLAMNDIAGDGAGQGQFGNAKDPNYAVMATERNLYVFRLRPRSFTKFDELTAKHAIGSVDVVLCSLSGQMFIGDLFVGTGFQRARAKRLLAAVGGSFIDAQAFEDRRVAIAEARARRIT
jgi:hypothetical protein